MGMLVHDVLQGTEEWHELRRGILTASEVNLILTPKKLEPAKGDQVRKLAMQKAVDRVYNYPRDDTFSSFHTERGKMEEDFAIEEYEKITGHKVERVGFVTNQFGIVAIGCSPDGLPTSDKLLEIKSRINREQVRVILANEMPDDFRLQVQTQMMVCEVSSCDFVSFSNGMPLMIKNIKASESIQAAIKTAAAELEKQIASVVETYKEAAKNLPSTPYRDYSELFEIQV
jgi:putative phage-type endonuclease